MSRVYKLMYIDICYTWVFIRSRRSHYDCANFPLSVVSTCSLPLCKYHAQSCACNFTTQTCRPHIIPRGCTTWCSSGPETSLHNDRAAPRPKWNPIKIAHLKQGDGRRQPALPRVHNVMHLSCDAVTQSLTKLVTDLAHGRYISDSVASEMW